MSQNFMPLTQTIISNIFHTYLEPIEYSESMTPEVLTDIALKYMVRNEYDNMKICFSMAIEKHHISAMLHFARYYEQVEENDDEVIRLYNLALENGSKDGAYMLGQFYKIKNDIPNACKYFDIGIERFKDEDSIYILIMHYQSINDEVNSMKYCDKLIECNPIKGYFIKGKSCELFQKYSEMKENYNKFLNTVDPNLIKFNNDELNQYEKHFGYIIRLYLENEIDLSFMQYVLHKFNITTSGILGHLQYKLNKCKLSIYKQTGTCPICYADNIELQLFDCLGHHYCKDCTIGLEKCAMCKCTKKCLH